LLPTKSKYKKYRLHTIIAIALNDHVESFLERRKEAGAARSIVTVRVMIRVAAAAAAAAGMAAPTWVGAGKKIGTEQIVMHERLF
jgi:hypothetical protein